MTISRLGVVAGLLLAASAASAADISPAVVFDMGGKFDKSFNQGVYDGAERFKQESGISYREFEVTNETQREQALRRMAQRGANPILGVGFDAGWWPHTLRAASTRLISYSTSSRALAAVSALNRCGVSGVQQLGTGASTVHGLG